MGAAPSEPVTIWQAVIPAALALAALGIGALHWGLRAPRLRPALSPADVDLPFETLHIPTARNRQLAAWWVPAQGRARYAAVVIHGWGGNRGHMLPVAALLHRQGVHVLLIDARGHGESDADTYSALPRFAEDLEAALDWVRRRPEAESLSVLLVGHSVGAAAALLAGSRRPEVRGVIALSTFAHPARLMSRFFREHRVPAPLIPLALRYIEWVIGHRFEDIAPVHTVHRIQAPVLLIHGTKDCVVPVEDARTVADALPHVHLAEIPGAGHALRLDADQGERLIRTFLARVEVAASADT